MAIDFIKADMEEFIAGCAIRFCPECGEKIEIDRKHLAIGRPKTFCSDACRRKFWKAHPKVYEWDCFEEKVCPACGRMFLAQHENKRERKYCSRACANRGRALERKMV